MIRLWQFQLLYAVMFIWLCAAAQHNGLYGSSKYITGCPGEIKNTTLPGQNYATVSWEAPTSNSPDVVVSSASYPDHLGQFEIGVTEVTYTAEEGQNDPLDTCVFNVVIKDIEPPVISNCPLNMTCYASTGDAFGELRVEWADVSASDNSKNVTVVESNQSGDLFPVGNHLINITAIDGSGNKAHCVFMVSVKEAYPATTTDAPSLLQPTETKELSPDETTLADPNQPYPRPISQGSVTAPRTLRRTEQRVIHTEGITETDGMDTTTAVPSGDLVDRVSNLLSRVSIIGSDAPIEHDLLESVLDDLGDILMGEDLQTDILDAEQTIAVCEDLVEANSHFLDSTLSGFWEERREMNQMGVFEIVKNVDAIAEIIGNLLQESDTTESLALNAQNIEMQAATFELESFDGFRYGGDLPDAPSDVGSYIEISASAIDGSDIGQVTIVVSRYKTLHSLLMENQTFELETKSSRQSYQHTSVNSDIIAMSLYPDFESVKSPSTNYPVKTKHVTITSHGETEEPRCAFIDFRQPVPSWSSRGSRMDELTADYVKCSWSHLTNFAILMMPVDVSDLGVHTTILSVLTYIGSALSIMGILLTLTSIIYFRFRSERFLILMNLSAVLAAAQITFLAGIEATSNQTVCQIVAVLLHYFYLTVFHWMLAQGIQLFVKVRNMCHGRYRLVSFYCVGYLLPLFIVGVSMATGLENYGTSKFCWLSNDDGHIFAFIGPAVFVILVNSVVLIAVMKAFLSIRATAKKSDSEKIKSGLRAGVMLLPILGLTWLFGVFSFSQHTIFFQYLFVIFNSTQGFAVFIFHCVLNDEVRNAWNRKRGGLAFKTSSYPSSSSSDSKTMTSNVNQETTCTAAGTDKSAMTDSKTRLNKVQQAWN
ncbi:adhesion G protein-coupled receptor L4-like [Ptychodera flava]|uniref:adhesion G protein-coupled receptor L4-like n=1 Tax=Ptychodera flava TaxID=63121 RepID=UPI00396A8573